MTEKQKALLDIYEQVKTKLESLSVGCADRLEILDMVTQAVITSAGLKKCNH